MNNPNTERFEELVHGIVYTLALVYFAGYYLRELLPSGLTNESLALPLKVVHAIVIYPILCLVGYALLTTYVRVTILGRELIADFNLSIALQTVRSTASGYLARLVRTIK